MAEVTKTAEIVDLPNERVTYDDKGHLDEVATHGGAHLEHLGGKNWFLSCQRADGTTVDLWFEGKINDMEDDGDPGLWFKTHRRVCRSCEGIGHVPVEAAEHIETLARERDRAVEALAELKWQSVDRDNMEFAARITCWQMDRIRAVLAEIDTETEGGGE